MTYLKIQMIIDKYDPQGLLKMGAPQNEYESEAKMIFNDLNSIHSQEECLQLVFAVFSSMFGANLAGEVDSYSQLAQEIWIRKIDKWQ